MKVGDLVKINSGSPYFGNIGIVANIENSHKTVFYDVLLVGESSPLRFLENVMEKISESR